MLVPFITSQVASLPKKAINHNNSGTDVSVPELHYLELINITK